MAHHKRKKKYGKAKGPKHHKGHSRKRKHR
jgi:hypothetical protein